MSGSETEIRYASGEGKAPFSKPVVWLWGAPLTWVILEINFSFVWSSVCKRRKIPEVFCPEAEYCILQQDLSLWLRVISSNRVVSMLVAI